MLYYTPLEGSNYFVPNVKHAEVEATEMHASARGSQLPNPPFINRKRCASEHVEELPLHSILNKVTFYISRNTAIPTLRTNDSPT